MVDHERVQSLVRELLGAIGEDPSREGLLETPRRVADMYVELFQGNEADPGEHLRVTFDAGHDEMVMVRDIAFTSLCEHHLVPFVGFAHLAYLPGPEGNIAKLLLSEAGHETAAILAELAGPDAAFLEGPGAMAATLVLMNRAMSIAGGTSEIKRNQIAERILGTFPCPLPRP